MKILFLSAHLPSPLSGQAGQKTSYHICEFLARRHDLYMLCFGTQNELSAFDRQGMEIFHSWDVVSVSRWTRLNGVLSGPRLPVSVAARNSRTFRGKLRHLTDPHRFDVVVLNHSAMWQYANDLVGTPLRVGLAHDVLTQFWERRADDPHNTLASIVLRMEAKRVQSWEQQALSQLDLVIVQSDKDGTLLGRLNPKPKRFVVQSWVSVPARTFSPTTPTIRDPGSVVFWGALDRSVNTDAVAYALRDIFPRVREAVPSAKFYVAGSNSETVASLTDGVPQVVRTGFVNDISAFLSSMQVALLPLRQGAGIKAKTLECLAAGVAVVTTPIGIEGIAVEHGVHLLVGESTQELASYTVRLLCNPEEARQMGARAQDWFASEYDFDQSMAAVESLLESLVAANMSRAERRESLGSCTADMDRDQTNAQFTVTKS